MLSMYHFYHQIITIHYLQSVNQHEIYINVNIFDLQKPFSQDRHEDMRTKQFLLQFFGECNIFEKFKAHK